MCSHWRSQLILTAVVYCALFSRVSPSPLTHIHHRRQIPCDHPLRLVVPSLFSHCETICTYSNWTSWQTIQRRIPTNKTMCDSEQYYIQQRTRNLISAIGESADCTEVNQTRKICSQTQIERFISDLGLGGSDQQYNSIQGPRGPQIQLPEEGGGGGGGGGGFITHSIVNPGPSTVSDTSHCPPQTQSSGGEVCKVLSASRACKRSASEFHYAPKKRHAKRPLSHDEVISVNDGSAPIPFDWNIHGSHFRQRRQTRCGNDDIQRVLFVLDSSGSVGLQNFEDMKNAIAKLVPLFCKQIETALISFSSDIRLEYCFHCFQNTIQGRSQAQAAIRGAEYLGDCTNTGATAKCICDDILSGSCGLETTECLDVVFITDGYSNDPNLRVCDEITCLHNQVGINTYAIGIGGYNRRELECIAHNTDDFGMFEYETFQEFKDSIDDVVELVTNATIGGNWHSCSARGQSFSPTGGPYTG